MSNIYRRIRGFWDNQPCGSAEINLSPENPNYFIDFDRFYEQKYPYLLPFLNLEGMQDKKVLEIGPGLGFTLNRIANVAHNTFGLDISIETLRVNQQRAQKPAAALNLIQASATDIPLQDNSIDAVVSIGCLHHIPNIQAAIAEVHRILKPGGIFKGMVYNRKSFRFQMYIPIMRRFSSKWRGKSWQECVNEMYDGSGNPYGMVYSKAEVSALFKDFSEIEFEVQNFVGEELWPSVGRKIPHHIWLSTLGRIWGLDLYFTAKATK